MASGFWGLVLRYRALLVAVVNVLLAGAAYYLAFALRLDTFQPWKTQYGRIFVPMLPVILVIRFGMFLAFDLFRGMWRYVSISDLVTILKSVTLGSVLFVPIAIFVGADGEFYSKSVFVLDWALCILLLGGVRFAIRTFRETFSPMREGGKKVLLVGAGDAGELLLRELTTHQHLKYQAVGFVDDDPAKWGRKIHGVTVLGNLEAVPKIVERESVDEIIVCIPSASGKEMQRILDTCRETRIRLKRIPTAGDIIRLTQIRDVELEDLLEREPVRLEHQRIREDLAGKRILITGAGGSIGSELVRKIVGYDPAHVVLLDWSENSLFFLEREMLDHFPDVQFDLVVADIKDVDRMDALFKAQRFDRVYHAAAFKHVPLMEANPLEAVKNNIGGTAVLADCSSRHGVEKFIFISSDKAVRPTSVMGATKRAAELMLSSRPRNGTQFLSVRFGNVMGSRGSVIPLFKKQIKEGGPVTVTHPDVVRYFMTIPEAVELVLQAGVMGSGGEVFVLDMGEPVKIVELARKLIRLSGFRPDEDIPIRFVGMRPGEKLYEELRVDREGMEPSSHEKIWVLKGEPPDMRLTDERVAAVLALARTFDELAGIGGLRDLVTDYSPNNARFRDHLMLPAAGADS